MGRSACEQRIGRMSSEKILPPARGGTGQAARSRLPFGRLDLPADRPFLGVWVKSMLADPG